MAWIAEQMMPVHMHVDKVSMPRRVGGHLVQYSLIKKYHSFGKEL